MTSAGHPAEHLSSRTRGGSAFEMSHTATVPRLHTGHHPISGKLGSPPPKTVDDPVRSTPARSSATHTRSTSFAYSVGFSRRGEGEGSARVVESEDDDAGSRA